MTVLDTMKYSMHGALGVGKKILDDGKDLMPVMLMFHTGKAPEFISLDLSNKKMAYKAIQSVIMLRKPLYAIIVADSCIASFSNDDPEYERKMKDSQEKGVSGMPENERSDAIVVMGGCIYGQYILTHKYKKEGGEIKYEGEVEMHDNSEEGSEVESGFFGDVWERIWSDSAKEYNS